MEPTSRPRSRMNSRVTKFTRAPLSIKQVVSTPSKITVPKLERLNQRFLASSFQYSEGVNRGPASFSLRPDQPWPYLFGGGQATLAPAPPSQFNDFLMVRPFFRLLHGFLERFGAISPAMNLLPAVQALTPFLSLFGHIDYGHVVTVIVYLTRINVTTGGLGGFILFGFRKLYISMPYGVGSGFIIWGTLAPMVCGVLFVLSWLWGFGIVFTG